MTVSPRVANVFASKCEDPTMLTSTLQQTELVGKHHHYILSHCHTVTLSHCHSHTSSPGVMQLLYAILLHDGPPRHSSSPLPLPHSTLTIATAAMKAINNCAILHLNTVQVFLTFSPLHTPPPSFPPFSLHTHTPPPPSFSPSLLHTHTHLLPPFLPSPFTHTPPPPSFSPSLLHTHTH